MIAAHESKGLSLGTLDGMPIQCDKLRERGVARAKREPFPKPESGLEARFTRVGSCPNIL